MFCHANYPDSDDYCANSVSLSVKSEPNHYSCQHDSRHNQGQNNIAFLQPSTLHMPLVLVELCNLSRKRLWCQLAEKFWTLLDGMTGCLECQQRRLQNDGVWWKLLPAWNGRTNAAGKRLARCSE